VPQAPSVRLNIGCGMAPTPGWLNYDNSPAVRLAAWPLASRVLSALGAIDRGNLEFAAFCRRHGIRHADAVTRIPHTDGSVDAIYSSHMIEHLDRREAAGFLGECRRVLKPGGILRIVVPDLRVTVNDYVARGNAEIFLDQLQLELDKPRGLRGHLRNMLLGGRNHHWLYDGPSIARLLERSGFDDVSALPPGQSRIADPGELNLHERAGESAYVEGVRPPAA
jgi:predicted SAM-dependent methyltransferase